MYNSVIVGGLVKLWNLFYGFYEKSFFKKIVDKIKNFFGYLFQYSKTKRIFTSKDSLISKSGFYKGISKGVSFVDKIFEAIHNFFAKLANGSWFCKSIQVQFKDNKWALKTLSIFFISLFSGIILNSIFVFREGSMKLYIGSIIFILIGIFGMKFSNNYKQVLNNSSIWKFIDGIFSIDEGGEQWW